MGRSGCPCPPMRPIQRPRVPTTLFGFLFWASQFARQKENAPSPRAPQTRLFSFASKISAWPFQKAICLFLIVRRHAKHANRHRLVVALNVPLFNVELDDRSCGERSASVFLILHLVMIAFRLQYPAAHESVAVGRRSLQPFAILL